MHVNHLSFLSFAYVQGGLYTGYYHAIRLHTTYFSGPLSTDPLFSFRSLWRARDKTIKTAGDLNILNPKSQVNPMPCKFAMFCSVNNLSSLSGYFSTFHHHDFAVKPKWNRHFHEYSMP